MVEGFLFGLGVLAALVFGPSLVGLALFAIVGAGVLAIGAAVIFGAFYLYQEDPAGFVACALLISVLAIPYWYCEWKHKKKQEVIPAPPQAFEDRYSFLKPTED